MSDDLPTPERLDRIRRGVERRIDLRRRIARRVAGGSVAVLLVAGGFALLPHLGLSSAGGSAASSGGGDRSALVPVVCHGSATFTAKADRSGLPASAITACARGVQAGFSGQHADGTAASASAPSPSSSPSAVLCRADDGALHLWPAATGTCAAHGMVPAAG